MSAMKIMLEDIIYQAAEKSKIDAGILMTAFSAKAPPHIGFTLFLLRHINQ